MKKTGKFNQKKLMKILMAAVSAIFVILLIPQIIHFLVEYSAHSEPLCPQLRAT